MPRAPILLAFDTATSVCSVALAIDGAIHEVAREVGQRHTEHLLSMIDALLASHAASLAECAALAFGAGPGSFTGLRVACGIAQGLAYGVDRPVIPIANLAAAALDVFERRPAARRVLVAQDARMNEAYCAVYSFTDGSVVEVAPAALSLPEDLVALADRYAVDTIAGSALQSFDEPLQALACARVEETVGSARSIAKLALDALRHGATLDPAAAAPLYVRDRVALTVEERRVRSTTLARADR